jgi:hypothetical protein
MQKQAQIYRFVQKPVLANLQALELTRGKLGGSAGRATTNHARPSLDQKLVTPGVDRRGPHAQSPRDGVHLLAVAQEEQVAQLLDLPLLASTPRQPQAVGQLLDGLAAEGYSRGS